ncbi:MAG: TolC family protein [Acidobacteria bacterium]|nr:TolC family protein [Acidobacteriota bacterium]
MSIFVLGVFLALSFVVRAEPVTMEQAIAEGLNRNPDLVAARSGIPVAEARRITAALKPNPVLTLDADHLDVLGTRFKPENNGGPNEVSVRVDYLRERGSKRENRIALAESEKSVAELTVRETARQVIFAIQCAFVDVQQAQESLALARQNLASLNGIVEINTAKVKAGDLAVVELSRSQIAAMQLQTAMRQAELQVLQAKTRLQFLMGRQQSAVDFEIAGAVRGEALAFGVDELREMAEKLRPDLAALRQTQARSRSDLKLQISQRVVDYTVGTEYRRSQWPGGANSMGFFVSAPLAIHNRNQGEIARAEREIEQWALRIQAARAGIENEVRTAYQQHTSVRELMQQIEPSLLAKAKSVRDTTEYSYRRGEASLVEFLDAQRAYNDSVQSYNEVRANYARSLYLIDSVTGRSVNR